MDDFESILAKQALKPAPDTWRAGILAHAHEVKLQRTSPIRQANKGLRVLALIRGWLWPHPGAWGALAVIWLLLCLMQHQINVEIHEELALAGIQAPATDVMAAMEHHRFVIEQLLAMNDAVLPILDRPKRPPSFITNRPPLMILAS